MASDPSRYAGLGKDTRTEFAMNTIQTHSEPLRVEGLESEVGVLWGPVSWQKLFTDLEISPSNELPIGKGSNFLSGTRS